MSNRAYDVVTGTFAVQVDPRRLWPFGLLAAGGVLGLIAAIQPMLALMGILAAIFVPVVLARPIIGLCTLLLFSFLESLSHLSDSFSVTKIVGLLLVLAWAALVATASRDERARFSLFARQPLLATALLLFLAWAVLSVVWAERPGSGADAAFRFALNFMLFPIALVAVRLPRHVIALFAVFVAAALTAATFGLASAPADAEGRLGGVGLNPNQLGQLLAVAVVLAVALAASRRWPAIARLAAIAATSFAAVALYMTLSRGALIGLGVAVLVAPFAVGRGRRAGALVLVVAAFAATVGWFAAVAPESEAQRIINPQEEGGSGREDLWRVGWRMVEDRPIRGVGAGNFPVASIHYVLRPGSTTHDEFIIDTPKVPHNVYLEVLAELGLVGLALFVVILATSLRCALVAARTFARQNDRMMEILARGLFIALIGLLAAEFFSSQLYSKQLWLLLATAPALLAIAEHGLGNDRRRVTPVARMQPYERARPGG